MEMKPVTSTSIKAIGYDKATGTMQIQFANATYSYEGVSPEVHDAFVNAESVGKAFYASIRGQFHGVKIE